MARKGLYGEFQRAASDLHIVSTCSYTCFLARLNEPRWWASCPLLLWDMNHAAGSTCTLGFLANYFIIVTCVCRMGLTSLATVIGNMTPTPHDEEYSISTQGLPHKLRMWQVLRNGHTRSTVIPCADGTLQTERTLLGPSRDQFRAATQSRPTLRSPWTAAHQASLSIANSQSLLKLMSLTLVMPPNHLTG